MNCEKCGMPTGGEALCENCIVTVGKKSMKPRSSEARTQDVVEQLKLPKNTPSGKPAHSSSPIEAQSPKKSFDKNFAIIYGLLGVIVLAGIAYVSSVNTRISDLENQVSYLEMTVSGLETDLSNAESKITYTQDWAYDELVEIVGCTNDFIEAWSTRGSTFMCRNPSIP